MKYGQGVEPMDGEYKDVRSLPGLAQYLLQE